MKDFQIGKIVFGDRDPAPNAAASTKPSPSDILLIGPYQDPALKIAQLEAALTDSRRANAMLREALVDLDAAMIGGFDTLEARTNSRKAIIAARSALSATAAEQKAWEDALWGEPVAEYKQWIDEHGGQRGGIYGITPEQITPGTLFYAKPKGLK